MIPSITDLLFFKSCCSSLLVICVDDLTFIRILNSYIVLLRCAIPLWTCSFVFSVFLTMSIVVLMYYSSGISLVVIVLLNGSRSFFTSSFSPYSRNSFSIWSMHGAFLSFTFFGFSPIYAIWNIVFGSVSGPSGFSIFRNCKIL